jgi:hypothetical protein
VIHTARARPAGAGRGKVLHPHKTKPSMDAAAQTAENLTVAAMGRIFAPQVADCHRSALSWDSPHAHG